MNLIGQKVKHILLGEGIVLEQDDKYVTVSFETKTSKFVTYPDKSNVSAFERYIKLDDTDLQSQIMAEIQALHYKEEQKLLSEEEAKKKFEKQKLKNEEEQRQTVSKKNEFSSKPTSRPHRESGKRITFFVFQGNTFYKEFSGSYIWAPISNKAGTSPHHWTRLLDVRKGDIILHGCDGYIRAISVARDMCYECKQPKELIVEGLWDIDGRRIDCDYTQIRRPIKTSNYTSEILSLCRAKYSPFNKYGNGNMGYLFEINRELARIFVSESVKHNEYLLSVDYISEFLSENNKY